MSIRTKSIPEYSKLTGSQFFSEIVPAQQPVVIRGYAKRWPLVAVAKQSDSAFIEYLEKFYNGNKVRISAAPHTAQKRFFYNAQMTGYTFASAEESLSKLMRRLLELKGRENCPALSMQSAVADTILPGLMANNPGDFLGSNQQFDNARPRLWLGNESVVDTHYDGTDNLACVVTGKRQFVLFPPDQTGNLYPGPLENTPAGVPVSLVDFRNPDFERFPLYRTALDNAYQVELMPGDALFIPMLWWHFVAATAPLNGLINYWWNGSFAAGASPPNYLDSLKIAVLAMRDFTPNQRQAWRHLFHHYLFRKGPDPASYIPQHQLHLLGEISPEYERTVKDFFVRKLQYSLSQATQNEKQ